MWQVYSCMLLAVIIVSLLWVSGIDYMQTNYPDYKGNGEGFDFDDKDEKQEDIKLGENVEVIDNKETKTHKKK